MRRLPDEFGTSQGSIRAVPDASGCPLGDGVVRHASSDRRHAHRPGHEVDRPRRVARRRRRVLEFAAKLADVQNNEASSWLPASAESTRALEKLGPFQDPNAIPTIVVYERDGGLTRGRPRRRDRARGRSSPRWTAWSGEVRPSVRHPASRGRCRPRRRHRRPSTFGSEGWNQMPDVADELRDIADSTASTSTSPEPAARPPTRPRRSAASTPPCSSRTLGVVILILLFTYRSPILWVLPIICAGRRPVRLPGRHLLPGQVRRPHRQRAEPRDPDHPRDRRRHRLRPAAGGALPRGAASSRGPARGDGASRCTVPPRRSWPAPRPSWSACCACCSPR